MSKIILRVGLGTCGIAAGADDVFEVLEQKLGANPDIELKKVGCIGMCYAEPLVEIENSTGRYLFQNVDSKKTEEILSQYILPDANLQEYQLTNVEFLKNQERIVLRNCGTIDPVNIDDYIKHEGFSALNKAIRQMTPDSVIQEILESGLRGRGGGGFPTGRKWRFTRDSQGSKKYVICNGDEGDPGAFMDRAIMEGDPFSVIEGMIIAAYAIGACEGYLYVRAEYPLAIDNLREAIKKCYEKGYLGKNILQSDFSFDLRIKEGAGAFVCGEETALIGSIEGKRGMPKKRPPFPAVKGLNEKPTNINNVETFANVAWIINKGAEAYAKFGTDKSKGTKVFALAGKVKRGGLVEVPMGITIRNIIDNIGGGTSGGPLKAVQLGGPSGGCVPESLFDTAIDYDSLAQTGAIMGSGGMIVMDHSNCMVDIARYFLSFTQSESCGKCTFCRAGTKKMLQLLEKITQGKGSNQDVEALKELAGNIKAGSLCGLGQTAPNPVLTTMKYFQHEYDRHIQDKRCSAAYCNALIELTINEKCIGCGACKRACPVNAISGERKELHHIDQETCIHCKMCIGACKFKAISVE